MVMTEEDMDGGRPVSRQLPLKAAWKNGEAKYNTSLCALRHENVLNAHLPAVRSQSTWGNSPERCTFHDDFDGSQERSAAGKRFVDLDGLIRIVQVQISDWVFWFVFLVRPWRRTGRTEDA